MITKREEKNPNNEQNAILSNQGGIICRIDFSGHTGL